jgi:succinate dehydrogenase/fumarate reductase-like Fe-S protein
MNQEITALVFRFDPDQDREPRFDEYRVRAEEEVSVLVLLDRIQKEIDQTLSFRSYCCGLQMCGSCLMKINQKKRFACITLVRPGEKVAIEPTSFPEGHIKDLVVKMEDQR